MEEDDMRRALVYLGLFLLLGIATAFILRAVMRDPAPSVPPVVVEPPPDTTSTAPPDTTGWHEAPPDTVPPDWAPPDSVPPPDPDRPRGGQGKDKEHPHG
jgi:hypothetical protein